MAAQGEAFTGLPPGRWLPQSYLSGRQTPTAGLTWTPDCVYGMGRDWRATWGMAEGGPTAEQVLGANTAATIVEGIQESFLLKSWGRRHIPNFCGRWGPAALALLASGRPPVRELNAGLGSKRQLTPQDGPCASLS